MTGVGASAALGFRGRPLLTMAPRAASAGAERRSSNEPPELKVPVRKRHASIVQKSHRSR
jgi:hypothetical protein